MISLYGKYHYSGLGDRTVEELRSDETSSNFLAYWAAIILSLYGANLALANLYPFMAIIRPKGI